MDIKQEHQEEEQVVRVDTSDSEESKKNLMEKRLELIEVMRRSEPPSFIGSATLLKDLKVAVDLHIFPYDKFYTRQKVASGPIFLCFKELGWTQATLVLDFKRAKYCEAIIDYVLQRVSELRQRAVACIAKKCQGMSYCCTSLQLVESH